MAGPLEGIRVLEFGSFVAGPYAGQLLADMGADVIKIEPPAGDPWRHASSFTKNESRVFIPLNRGTRSICLDLKKESGKAAFLFAQANDIRNSQKHSLIYKLFYKKIVTYKRAVGKYKTRKLLETATCIKEAANIHYLPRIAAFMGYWPVIVLNYRDFPEWAGSMYPGQRYFSIETLTQDYVSTMENSVALLGLFGGCVIDYKELMDTNAEDWARVLGEVTGLDGGVILESRNRRFRNPGPESPLPVRNSNVEEILALVRQYEGRPVDPRACDHRDTAHREHCQPDRPGPRRVHRSWFGCRVVRWHFERCSDVLGCGHRAALRCGHALSPDGYQ